MHSSEGGKIRRDTARIIAKGREERTGLTRLAGEREFFFLVLCGYYVIERVS